MIVTVEIPCGSPQTYFTGGGPARDWALGSVSALDYADLIDANTAPHDPSTSSAPNDGNYLTMNQAGFFADMVGRGYAPDGRYHLLSVGRMDYPASIPAGITELLIVPIFRARTSSITPARSFHAVAYTGNGTESYMYTSANLTSTDWYSNDAAGFFSVFHTGVEAARVALNAGLGHVTVQPFDWGTAGPSWVDDVDYMAIRLQYEVSGCPPLRQFPRTDGLATSSAPRLVPASRSRQRSNRRAGGYL